jgi:hypothetical protein
VLLISKGRMTCRIDDQSSFKKWVVSQEAINKITKFLYLETEKSGTFSINTETKGTDKDITIIHGDKDSVETPLSLVNYHTHPISCYVQEKCVYGWLSGEDIRECIIFALQGTIAHVVCAIEGAYVCQINPCILETLVKLKKEDFTISSGMNALLKKNGIDRIVDFYRGLIITCIEVYFRSTHAFRTAKFNKGHKICADDYIKFINKFKYSNMFKSGTKSAKKRNGSEKEKIVMSGNGGVWTYENSLKKMSYQAYIKNYEDDTCITMCDKHGNRTNTSITMLDIVENDGLITKFPLSSCKYTKELWSENWFLVKLYYSKINKNSEWVIYDSLRTNDKTNFIKNCKENDIEVTDKPVFYFFDLVGICDHNHVKNNLNSFGNKSRKRSKKIIIYGSDKCSYCTKALDKYTKLNYEIKKHYFGTIKDAVEAAQQIDDSITTIPAIFTKIN